jgi:hypothetical protein
MKLPAHKTKIVCTIGPASRSEAVLEQLILQGMNVARLNFAHGTLKGHREDIRRIRAMASKTARSCLIMADLPGPKIRVGKLIQEPLLLEKDNKITLTVQNSVGSEDQIPVEYKRLPESVNPGNLSEKCKIFSPVFYSTPAFCPNDRSTIAMVAIITKRSYVTNGRIWPFQITINGRTGMLVPFK